MPDYMFNAYGASLDWIGRDRALLRDTAAAMIEANRAMFRDKAKVVPIIEKATDKPRDAVEYAIDVLTKNCVWSIKYRLRSPAHPMVDRQQRRERRHRQGEKAERRAGRKYCARQRGGRGRGRRGHHRQLQGLTDMNVQTRPSGHRQWDEVRTRLDQNAPFSNMHATA